MIDRRGFLTAATASIFVPQFGRFFREGSGLLVPRTSVVVPTWQVDPLEELSWLAKDYFRHVYHKAYALETPLQAQFRGLSAAQYTGRPFTFGVRTV